MSAPAHNETRGTREKSRHPLAAWRRHHRQCLRGALARLIRRPVGAWATILVLGVVLSLPALVMTLGHQVERLGAIWMSDAARMDLYLAPGTDEAERESLRDWLDRQATVAEQRVIPPDEGLETLTERLHMNGLEGLDSNPLPWVIELTLSDARPDTRLALAEGLREQSAVAEFSSGGEWIERLEQIRAFFDELGWWLLILLGLTVVFVVGNTLRLELHERRREIALIALIGGTERYMLRPLLYDGTLTGLLGGLVASGLVALAVSVTAGPIERFAASYGAAIAPQIDPTLVLLLMTAGALLGWLSAQVIGRFYIGRLSTP
ncbi:FtsX-like permease family protein [Guyparkeria halophila]|uniref:Cell division protein FtsX n=1 Tax=Guyparkeria halophila TaxID=47960 RepID=A0A6I6D3S2_9GAMM|nr:permease-like cell division protein FtsX [Guyparkeria halophila]QGT78001.1 FtsX-like permease family protein [Guyparkeria halophila]